MRRLSWPSLVSMGGFGAFLFFILPAVAGCGSTKSATAPSVPEIPSCQMNNTASIRFENRSNSNSTYDVLWDGSKTMTLAPGQLSDGRTVAAGVQHTLSFVLTNSGGRPACSTSTPTLAQCSSHTYWCTF